VATGTSTTFPAQYISIPRWSVDDCAWTYFANSWRFSDFAGSPRGHAKFTRCLL